MPLYSLPTKAYYILRQYSDHLASHDIAQSYKETRLQTTIKTSDINQDGCCGHSGEPRDLWGCFRARKTSSNNICLWGETKYLLISRQRSHKESTSCLQTRGVTNNATASGVPLFVSRHDTTTTQRTLSLKSGIIILHRLQESKKNYYTLELGPTFVAIVPLPNGTRWFSR